jgi:positive regulator of sigma E activity
MPTRWLVFAIVLFAITMFAVKTGMAAAMNTWGAWVGVVGIVLVFFIARLIDRSDANKRQRDVRD